MYKKSWCHKIIHVFAYKCGHCLIYRLCDWVGIVAILYMNYHRHNTSSVHPSVHPFCRPSIHILKDYPIVSLAIFPLYKKIDTNAGLEDSFPKDGNTINRGFHQIWKCELIYGNLTNVCKLINQKTRPFHKKVTSLSGLPFTHEPSRCLVTWKTLALFVKPS